METDLYLNGVPALIYVGSVLSLMWACLLCISILTGRNVVCYTCSGRYVAVA